MATIFSTALQNNNSSDVLFRLWCQFIDDTLVLTGGWVNTTDTGQLVISTATHPTVAGTFAGYRMYHMADTLQATAPIFMRIDYGPTSGVANTPRAQLTFGTGTNGAGVLTGNMGVTIPVTTNVNSAVATHSYGSADPGRLTLLMFVTVASDATMVLSVERTKDATGADTGAGILLSYSTNGYRAQYAIRTSGTPPPEEIGWSFVLSNQTTSAFGGDVGIGIPIHFKGIAQQPGVGIILTNSGDFLAEGVPTLSLYGTVHTYQLCSGGATGIPIVTGNATAAQRSNTRVGIRYE